MAYTDYIDPGNSGGSVPTPDTYYPIKTGAVFPVYTCDECKKIFNDKAKFDEHKYTDHPIKSPLIFIKNEQIGHTKKHFFEKLTPDEIKIDNCTYALVNNKNKVTPEKLIELLANKGTGFFKLDLVNKEYSRTYEIEFSVADIFSLDEIDKVFTTHFRQDDLTLSKIKKFSNDIKSYEDGREYVDAYLDYLYGVLAKEQNQDIVTSFSDYEVRFNKSYEILRHYPRPLARSVCAIILLNNNLFEKSHIMATHLPSISNTSIFIQNGNLNNIIGQKSSDKLIPIDWITEKIIKIYQVSPSNSEELAEYEEWLKSGLIPANDKDKMRVMLARKYKQAGNENKTIKLLKSLRNKPDFESIVNDILDKNND